MLDRVSHRQSSATVKVSVCGICYELVSERLKLEGKASVKRKPALGAASGVLQEAGGDSP
jgi:hypothetical protein